jgi:hypothetical protein
MILDRLSKGAEPVVDMTPDNQLPVRILREHIDQCEWTDNTSGAQPKDAFVAKVNELRLARNAILEQAIRILQDGLG